MVAADQVPCLAAAAAAAQPTAGSQRPRRTAASHTVPIHGRVSSTPQFKLHGPRKVGSTHVTDSRRAVIGVGSHGGKSLLAVLEHTVAMESLGCD